MNFHTKYIYERKSTKKLMQRLDTRIKVKLKLEANNALQELRLKVAEKRRQVEARKQAINAREAHINEIRMHFGQILSLISS